MSGAGRNDNPELEWRQSSEGFWQWRASDGYWYAADSAPIQGAADPPPPKGCVGAAPLSPSEWLNLFSEWGFRLARASSLVSAAARSGNVEGLAVVAERLRAVATEAEQALPEAADPRTDAAWKECLRALYSAVEVTKLGAATGRFDAVLRGAEEVSVAFDTLTEAIKGWKVTLLR